MPRSYLREESPSDTKREGPNQIGSKHNGHPDPAHLYNPRLRSSREFATVRVKNTEAADLNCTRR